MLTTNSLQIQGYEWVVNEPRENNIPCRYELLKAKVAILLDQVNIREKEMTAERENV